MKGEQFDHSDDALSSHTTPSTASYLYKYMYLLFNGLNLHLDLNGEYKII